MEVRVLDNGVLEINNARITACNFAGAEDMYNREGDRNFLLMFDDAEIANRLMDMGWPVKIKPSRVEGGDPFMFMKIKVVFNDRGPTAVLVTGGKAMLLNESTIHRLDRISRGRVDLDIRPYDWTMRDGKSGRTAYLNGIKVWQNIDRFAAELAEEEYPGEAPWN